MAFRVQEENSLLGTSELLPGQETTPQKAFNRAIERFVAWTQGGWNWNSNSPRPNDPNLGDINGPAPGGKYKVLINTKDPANLHINVRFDYFIGGPNNDWETNDIYWRVVEV